MMEGAIKPVMKSVKNVLFIGAHPDDIELGAGGTLLRHLKENDNVFIIIATGGERGNHIHPKDYNLRIRRKTRLKILNQERLKETLKAFIHAKIPKENIYALHLKDTDIDRKKLFNKIEQVCIEKDIHRIYTHTYKDYHQDHETVFHETVRAGRDVPDILTFESNSSSLATFSPTHFIDITDFIEDKMKLLKFHETQLEKRYLHAESILANAKFRGNQTRRFRYAEAFEPVRTISWDGGL